MMLQKTYTQVDTKGQDQSTLVIKVDYNPFTRTVDSVESVYVFDHKNCTISDITYIMNDWLNLDRIIDEINWPEVYAESKNLEVA